MAKQGTQLSPELQQARSELAAMLTETVPEIDEETKLPTGDQLPRLNTEERLLVIDRIIKIEALEHKKGTGKAGSAFDDEEE